MLDHELVASTDWRDFSTDFRVGALAESFDEIGNYQHTYAINSTAIDDPRLTEVLIPNDVAFEQFERATHFKLIDSNNDNFEEVFQDSVQPEAEIYSAPAPRVTRKPPDYESKRRCLVWLPVQVVKQTYQATTQFAKMAMSTHLHRFFRSLYPMLNHPPRNEDLYMDEIFSDTPCIETVALKPCSLAKGLHMLLMHLV